MQDNPAIPIVTCALYAVLIFGGKYVMKNRPAWNWRKSMVRFKFQRNTFIEQKIDVCWQAWCLFHSSSLPYPSLSSQQAAWNFALSLFSWIGTFRTLPQLLHNLASVSIRDNFCQDPAVTFGSGSSGLWVQLFILSKFPWVDDRLSHLWLHFYQKSECIIVRKPYVLSLTSFPLPYIRFPQWTARYILHRYP